MAHHIMWYNTNLPSELIDGIVGDLEGEFDEHMQESRLGTEGKINHDIRKSENVWLTVNNWIGQLIFSYVQRANKENFLYDIDHIENDNMQYTKYNVGEYYNWHTDGDLANYMAPVMQMDLYNIDMITQSELQVNLNAEKIRKLSFSLQLSDPDDYEGGNLQMQYGCSNPLVYAPRNKGSLTIFDSRVQHRVKKVTKGVRRSLVGWVIGPRWR